MNLWHDIPPGRKNHYNAIIEIPIGYRNKYEFDKKTGLIKLSRMLHTAFTYPFNYGFVPQTLAKDGDAMDVLVLGEKIHPGILVEVRIIGMMRMIDKGQTDDKLLAVPVKDPYYEEFNDMKNIPKHLLREIKHFFAHYKDLEGIKTKSIKWIGRKESITYLESGIKKYREKFR